MKNRRRMFTRTKRIAIEKDYDIDLLLSIDHAEGLDNHSTYPFSNHPGLPCFVFWVHPDDKLATSRDVGSPDPGMEPEVVRMKVDNSRDCRLFVCLRCLGMDPPLRVNPGSSNGISLVGRAQIPLTELVK
ncbi:hypothetical protein NC653_017039 [Populus alba x Populus x berolinensis]|uniref:Uncharacterized protein n=1 Tax=Populus alba x Populus x berolinensis TaxID=444605 RepID=A0AAD6QPP5_9ROSI|nr:hypothetical protein NC653_017039 [Populus alba x Populus x berolinensis]